MDVEAEISILDELGDDEDAIVRGWCPGKSKEEHDIGMAGFLHEPPFSLKVFCNVVVSRWEDLLDSDVNPQIRAFND